MKFLVIELLRISLKLTVYSCASIKLSTTATTVTLAYLFSLLIFNNKVVLLFFSYLGLFPF